MRFPRFRIIPVVIDDCEIPGFLANRLYYRLPNNNLDFDSCNKILEAMYGASLEVPASRDIYVSRTWRPSEAAVADSLCRQFAADGFRLIGDAEDHAHFTDSEDRIRQIISSTGGLLAILPHRAEEARNCYTSKYILREIRFARELNIPYVIFREVGVTLPKDLAAGAVLIRDIGSQTEGGAAAIGSERMLETWDAGHKRQYVFFASNFEFRERNAAIRAVIGRVTAMECVIGDEIVAASRSVQQEIVDKVANAFLVVADISESNLNTLIEVGVARGAGIRFSLLDGGPRHRPPFMLRDTQIFTYSDDVELLGQVHKIAYPFRRRILNLEL